MPDAFEAALVAGDGTPLVLTFVPGRDAFFTLTAGQQAALGAGTFNDPGLLLGAQAPVDYPTLYGLEQQYQFQNMGVVPSGGVDALVLHSSQPGTGHGGYYLMRTDGEFYAYDGSPTFAQTFANATPLANLGPATYANPSLLLAAHYWLVGRTNRRVHDPAQDFYAPFDQNHAVIVALWHGEHFLIPFLGRKGKRDRFIPLTTYHRDGEILTRAGLTPNIN